MYTLHFAGDKLVIAQDIDDAEYLTRKIIEKYKNGDKK
jgi:hypothetical protein